MDAGFTARGAGTGIVELGDCCEDEAKLEAELPRVLWAGDETRAFIVMSVRRRSLVEVCETGDISAKCPRGRD